MGQSANTRHQPIPTEKVRFYYLDTKTDEKGNIISEMEYSGEATVSPEFDGDDSRPSGWTANLIQAYDENDQPYLDFNDGLAERFEQAAIEAYHNPPYLPITLPTDAPPAGQKPRSNTAQINAIEATVTGLKFAAVADTDLITHSSGASFTHTEFPLGAIGPDGIAFNPYDISVADKVREALCQAAFEKYHKLK